MQRETRMQVPLAAHESPEGTVFEGLCGNLALQKVLKLAELTAHKDHCVVKQNMISGRRSAITKSTATEL